eukprot:403335743
MSVREFKGSVTYEAVVTFREKPEMKFKLDVKSGAALVKFKFNPQLQGELTLKDAEKCFEHWFEEKCKKEYEKITTVTLNTIEIDLEDFVFKDKTYKENELQHHKLKDVMQNGEKYKIKIDYKLTLTYQMIACCNIF